jgi:hypothetical protein
MSDRAIIAFFLYKKGATIIGNPFSVGLSYFFRATLAFGFFAFHFAANLL